MRYGTSARARESRCCVIREPVERSGQRRCGHQEAEKKYLWMEEGESRKTQREKKKKKSLRFNLKLWKTEIQNRDQSQVTSLNLG